MNPCWKNQRLVLQEGNLFLECDGELVPFRLFAGSMHYWRIPPTYWEDRIIKCQQLGCNTVETYVAWNIHEPEPNQWTFEGFADLVAFVKLVQKHNLYMIVRYSPYICAELDNGGIPYWLLRDRNIRLRSRDGKFMEPVKRFYRIMTEKLRPYFSTNGGPILAGQLENEYGCTQNDPYYLMEHFRYLVDELRIDIPLFNGVWAEERFIKSGQCDGTIAALNFNSEAHQKFTLLQKMSPSAPRVCTEFWVGWFSAWGGHRYKPRETPEMVARRFDELLEAKGHAILYLFHGGTNFGMTNGSNIRTGYCQWTITSYDYEAPLNEAGQITPYYEQIQQVAAKHGLIPNESITDLPTLVPPPVSYETIFVSEKTYLFDQLPTICNGTKISSPYPLSMEECNQAYGYLLYRTHVTGPTPPSEDGIGNDRLTINELRDRAHIFLNGEYLETLERNAGRGVAQTLKSFHVPSEGLRLDILVENQGRCNFPPFMQDFKGITENVFLGDCFVLSNWEHFPIMFSEQEMQQLTWYPVDDKRNEASCRVYYPSFFRAQWDLSTVTTPLRDTYIRLSEWQKGIVLVNGFNLGRYWNKGPQFSLYCPASLLVNGENEIVIFEEERVGTKVEFIEHLIMNA